MNSAGRLLVKGLLFLTAIATAAATISNRGSRASDSARSWLPMRFRFAIKMRTGCDGESAGGWNVGSLTAELRGVEGLEPIL
jgi:hypothetical protein